MREEKDITDFFSDHFIIIICTLADTHVRLALVHDVNWFKKERVRKKTPKNGTRKIFWLANFYLLFERAVGHHTITCKRRLHKDVYKLLLPSEHSTTIPVSLRSLHAEQHINDSLLDKTKNVNNYIVLGIGWMSVSHFYTKKTKIKLKICPWFGLKQYLNFGQMLDDTQLKNICIEHCWQVCDFG